MGYSTLSLGLTLTIPTNGTTNWGTTLFNTTWTKISQHSHTGGGDGNKISTAALVDAVITSAKLATNIALSQASTVTPVGTAQTLDFNLGVTQQLDLSSATGDVTATLSNPLTGATYKIWITQGATARDVIWPASVKWPQGQKPILSIGAGKVDYVELYYTGSVYRGLWQLDFS